MRLTHPLARYMMRRGYLSLWRVLLSPIHFTLKGYKIYLTCNLELLCQNEILGDIDADITAIDMPTLDIHEECKNQCRSSIIMQYIQQHPESLAIADVDGYLPLHSLLMHRSSSIDDALAMIEKYPAALQHPNDYGEYPLHIECIYLCRSIIISTFIELYPEALSKATDGGELPLNWLIQNKSSMIEDVLLMMEKYQAALQQPNEFGHLPLQIECVYRCRPPVITRCIELYPDALDEKCVISIFSRINKRDFDEYTSTLSLVLAIHPMSLYDRQHDIEGDIRHDPTYRRRILNLLPRHVFSLTQKADYCYLNWEPRAAMMMLLSKIKIKI
jgi:hypothetical protein